MSVPFKGLCFGPTALKSVGDYKPKSLLHELVVSGILNINYHDNHDISLLNFISVAHKYQPFYIAEIE